MHTYIQMYFQASHIIHGRNRGILPQLIFQCRLLLLKLPNYIVFPIHFSLEHIGEMFFSHFTIGSCLSSKLRIEYDLHFLTTFIWTKQFTTQDFYSSLHSYFPLVKAYNWHVLPMYQSDVKNITE
jgi:hypothetical protein